MIPEQTPRKEHDSFGEIEVPAGALWGAQTERARRNVQLSGTRLPPDFIAALALIKAAAAKANARLGLLPEAMAGASEAVWPMMAAPVSRTVLRKSARSGWVA